MRISPRIWRVALVNRLAWWGLTLWRINSTTASCHVLAIRVLSPSVLSSSLTNALSILKYLLFIRIMSSHRNGFCVIRLPTAIHYNHTFCWRVVSPNSHVALKCDLWGGTPEGYHRYFSVVGSGIPCAFIFTPTSKGNFLFDPKTFKVGPQDPKLFETPSPCVKTCPTNKREMNVIH